MGPPKPPDSVTDRAERAQAAPRHQTGQFFMETAKEVLVAFARNPNLQEPDLLRLLERKDLAPEVLREIAVHKQALRSYPVKLALARHPRTPRLISLPLLKFLHIFDLVRVAQTPAVPADVKRVVEEAILTKAERIPRSEKISLARRGSGRVAAGLLLTEDEELIRAVLDNPFLTEAHVVRVLSFEKLSPRVVGMLSRHDRWSCRYYLRLALVRNPHTPLDRVLNFLPDLAVNDLREACLDRRMPAHLRKYVLVYCERRLRARRVRP
ncbi:MAG: hypothetical protein ABSB82_06465 [Terriglobia bacterium]|jgi:hypothetical protein